MEDAAGEKKALGMRRCKSAMLAREMPPTKTIARKIVTRLVFDEAFDQIVITEMLKEEEPQLRRYKSTSGQLFVPDTTDKDHASELRRCRSSLDRILVDDRTDEDHKHELRRCESVK